MTISRYISFSLGKLRFIDSLQFLKAPLEKLVKANPKDSFNITAKYEPDLERQALLLKKGVYPYEYMDAWHRFHDGLPPKDEFYSSLTGDHFCEGLKRPYIFKIPKKPGKNRVDVLKYSNIYGTSI